MGSGFVFILFNNRAIQYHIEVVQRNRSLFQFFQSILYTYTRCVSFPLPSIFRRERYREWLKEKSKEARLSKRKQQAKTEEAAVRDRHKKAEGLRAYRRWVRLASKKK